MRNFEWILFFYGNLRLNYVLSYMIFSCNDDSGHVYFTWSRLRIFRWLTDVSINAHSVVDAVCIMLVARTCVRYNRTLALKIQS